MGRKEGAPLQFTPDRRALFLEAIRTTGLIGEACRAIGLSRECIRKHRDADSELDIEIANAMEDYADSVEMELQRRAIEGWEEPVFYQGRTVASVRKFSDMLLLAAAKKRRPEYRDAPRITLNDNRQVNIVAFSDRLAGVFAERREALKEVGVIEEVAGAEAGNGKPKARTNGNGSGNGSGE